MGYLICEECNIYYEAEDEMEAENFVCECGNKTIYFEYLEDYYETGNVSDNDELDTEDSSNTNNDELDDEYVRDRISDGLTHTEHKAYSYLAEKSRGFKMFLAGSVISAVSLILTLVFINTLYLVFCLILLLIGLALAGYGAHKKSVSDVKGYSWIRGLKGENAVLKCLETLPKDYFIFNDVKLPGKGGNIDHIVIGPSGVFVIETKNYSGKYRINGNKWFYYKNGKYIETSKSPGSQVIRNVVNLKNFMTKKGIPGLWMDAIVAFINQDFQVVKEPERYMVLVPETVPKYILKRRKKPDRELLKRIALNLEPYCTDISVSHKKTH